LVRERRVAVTAKSTLDVNIRRFPASYWKYLLAMAVFGVGNSSNSFLILRTRDIGVSLPTTIVSTRRSTWWRRASPIQSDRGLIDSVDGTSGHLLHCFVC
jgi:hypothetical protein